MTGGDRVSTFTDAQEEAFGQIVADNFGANIQTGFWDDPYKQRLDLEGQPYVATQMGPNLPVIFHVVKEDGEVIDL